MKSIVNLFILPLVLLSCGDGNTNSFEKAIASDQLDVLRAEKVKLEAQQQDIRDKMRQLNDRIAALDTNTKVSLITVAEVNTEEFKHYVELQGDVQTRQNVLIFAEFSGLLTRVNVQEGDPVKKGQLLAKIDDGGMTHQLAQMEIQADLARTTFERQERLWQQNIGSEIQYLQAKSNYEGLAKAVDQMRQQLAKTEIRAPFSGQIDDVLIEQGTVVAPGSALMRIVNLSDMYVETHVPESFLGAVTSGSEVLVDIPVIGKTLDARVRQTSNYINPANRTFKIEIPIEESDPMIRPNLTAKLRINDYTNPSALLIPQSVISEDAEGHQYIYVVASLDANNQGVATRQGITTGLADGSRIEVLEGLTDGMRIVVEGARSIKSGQLIEVSQTVIQ